MAENDIVAFKELASGGFVEVAVASTTTPAALGTAAVGTGTTFARADHVHALPNDGVVNAASLFDGALNQVGAVVSDAALNLYNDDDYAASLIYENITANRGYTLPDSSGTLALTESADSAFRVVGSTDATKKVAFEVDTLVSTATTRTLTVPNSSGTIALLETLPAGGTKTYAVFTATDNQPPSTAFATLDTRNSIAVLDFDDATDESAVFVSIIPEAASLGSGLKIRLHWMATTATSGNVVWDVSLERMNTDLDSDSFDTIASGTAAANGTSGILTVTEITLTTIDSVTAGDGFRLKVTRDANNASDTMTGDAELVVCEVRSAA